MVHPVSRRFFRHGMLPQLVAFEATARLGSVTRAAEELSVAQPTVSGLLRKLGEALETPLIELRAGRMEPTPEGRELLVLCREISESIGRYELRRDAAAESRSTASHLAAPEPARSLQVAPRSARKGEASARLAADLATD